MNAYRFTPRFADGQRAEMVLNAEDFAKIQGENWKAVITDQITDKTYEVEAAECGLPCVCDAIVVREL